MTDALVVVAAVAAVAWLSASAPWWALAVAGGVATLAGFGPLPVALGVAGAATAFAIGTARSDVSVARTASAGCTLLALSNLHLDGFFGATALIGMASAALMAGTGLPRRRQKIQTWVRRTAIVLTVAAGLAVAGAGPSMVSARSDLVEGQKFFEIGVDRLRSGDSGAAADFAQAERSFSKADRSMNRPWAQPARLVPVVGNHRAAAAIAARSGSAASADIRALADVVDLDALRPESGRFDVDVLELLGEPFSTAYTTLLGIGDDIDDAQSSWLIGSVQDELRAVADEFDDNIDTFGTLASAVERAPALLGADGPRRYFVAFTTPAEARGTGGFMGNFAVLTADSGLVTLSDFGRTLDLNRGFGERTVTAPDDWLRRWGRYGFTNGDGGTASDEPWSNITMSPQFPSTATAIASLFPQSGGSEIDGVIAIDPYVLAAFVGFTGPITVDRPGTEATRLTEHNTAQFLLFDQYDIDSDERVDALEQVATETMTELLDGALPDPAVLSDRIGPLVEAERLVAWMSNDADQTLIESIGMSGRLPQLRSDDDGFSVVVNNAGANKLDAFLTRSFRYDASYSTASGDGNGVGGAVVDGELSITLSSGAPSSGLSDGVIGNYVGDPTGTNRSLITVYTAASVESVTVDGDDVPIERGVEAGWTLTTFVVTTTAGASTDIVVRVMGSLPDSDDDNDRARPAERIDTSNPGLVVRTQPLVDTPSYRIATRTMDGRGVDYVGQVPGTRWWFPA